MLMKKDTQKHSRLRRCGRLNTSHFLLLGAEGGELICGTLRYVSEIIKDACMIFCFVLLLLLLLKLRYNRCYQQYMISKGVSFVVF